ncbi:hypothetical protein Tco_0281039 [Tanacetum coccineum]
MTITTSMTELESLFGPIFEEYFDGENQVVSKSSVVTAADTSNKRQQQLDSTLSTLTLATIVSADGNFDLVFHNDEWKSFQCHHETALRTAGNPVKEVLIMNLPDHRLRRWSNYLIPATSYSLTHAHAQATKMYYKHQDSRIKKA